MTGERFVVDEESENMELIPRSSEGRRSCDCRENFRFPSYRIRLWPCLGLRQTQLV